ncbi:MAG TPA: Kdo hydroxylase family protein, partial [Verrucomicrobiae bacterium]|nr:Kdo hydroxylase family protein [Verrucomicrobiae bacterium]
GQVLFFPQLAFKLADGEVRFLTPELVSGAKNVSYNFANRKLGHCACAEADRLVLAEMIHRFAEQAETLVEQLLPPYKPALTMGRTSLRPVEAAGRASSWRKDDTRLHVDAFPSTPLNGNRILRVFSNVNPSGRPRSWRVGEHFEQVSQRYLPGVRPPYPGSLMLMQMFRVTRGRRSLYDHYMLALHDAMKADDHYQKTCAQSTFDFPAQSTWMVYADSVPHAVTSGQHQFEQTFYVKAGGMAHPDKSPLRILEKQLGTSLAN